MKKYYVHTLKDIHGDHEVHAEGCYKMPDERNRLYLGVFPNCQDAVKEARQHYAPVNGCIHCCEPCHSS